MLDKQQEFASRLKCADSQRDQEAIAKETMRKQLFKIISKSDIENGKKLELNSATDLIALELGAEIDREKIRNYIAETLQSGEYIYKIDDGYIVPNLNGLAKAQKRYNDRGSQEAEEKLKSFVERVETFANNLSIKKIGITEQNLKNQFTQRELESSKIWIDLAVRQFLASKNQER